jgi:hypothetical protein
MKLLRVRQRLGREITVLLVVKVVLLLTIFFACFGPATKVHPTAQSATAHLLGSNYR